MVAHNHQTEFGLLAVRVGGVSPSQLAAAKSKCEQSNGRTLADALVEMGALTPESREAIDALLAAQRVFQDESDASGDGDTPTEAASPAARDSGETQDFLSGDTVHDETLPAPAMDEENRFHRQKLHAAGGLGEVYEAYDRQLNRTVALKEIKDQFADDGSSQDRFTKEAEITGRLEHPGIVPVYALGKYPDGRPYYAMRLIKGKSMRAAIDRYHAARPHKRRQQVLAWRALLGRLIDVCEAIYYAHRRGIVHRDIKPSNIMLGEYGETLVVDWGLAKNLGRREQQSTMTMLPAEETLMPASGSGLSKTILGKAIGSPSFMSPEQARGDHDAIGFGSDIYGLGATLYMILTGRAPVEGENSQEVLSKVRKGDITPPRDWDRTIPKSLEAICLRALAQEPCDRYTSVRAMRRDLEQFLADEPVAARKDSLAERGLRAVRHRRWLLPALLVGVMSLSAAVVMRQGLEQRHQRKLTVAAEEKQREVRDALQLTAEALGVIDPFGEIDANVERLDDTAREIQSRDLPELLKADILDKIVEVLKRFERPDSATPWAEESLRISQAQLGPLDAHTIRRQRTLAQVYRIDGDYERASQLLEDLVQRTKDQLGDQHFAFLHDLSVMQYDLGNMDEAIRLERDVVKHREEVSGPFSKDTITAKHGLGLMMSQAGKFEEANQLLADVATAVAQSEEFSTEDRLSMTQTQFTNFSRQGAHAEALAGFEKLYPEYVDKLGADHAKTLSMLTNIASAQQLLHRFDDAIANYREAIAGRTRVLGEEHERVWSTHLSLGSALLGAQQFEAAIAEIEPWLQKYIATYAFQRNSAHTGSRTLVYALIALQRYEEAAAVLERWQSGTKSRKTEVNFGRVLAAGEVALARDNLGSAEKLAAEAAAMLDEFQHTPGDNAGVLSLQGAIQLRRGQREAAAAKFNEAEQLFADQPESLHPYQIFWPELLQRRLEHDRISHESK